MKKYSVDVEKRTEKVQLPQRLVWGQSFTENCFRMDYNPSEGWHNAKITKMNNLEVHPALMVFHYAQSVFEGMKAFKTVDGKIKIFRPEKHIDRLNKSCERLVMPKVDKEMVLEALKELIKIESDWIPTGTGEALYIRPFMYAADAALGVRPSVEYTFIIILSPVGAYYPEGFKPVKILAQDDYVRAVRKGIGECKTSANYAASLLAADEAKRAGFSQVLWLDGIEQKYIEEVGTMNIFINFKDEVVTPALSGSILHGVTRDSVITILKDWGMNINERLISITEVVEKYNNGLVDSVFGTGTAAVISAVSNLSYKENNMIFNDGKPGELDLKLYDEITSIQYGKKEDRFNWLVDVN